MVDEERDEVEADTTYTHTHIHTTQAYAYEAILFFWFFGDWNLKLQKYPLYIQEKRERGTQ